MNQDDFIIQDLTASLDKNNFYLEYQPQFNSKSEFIGIESLSRWVNSEGNVVRPDIFIPLLEKNNLIYDFGLKVAEKAFHFSHTMEKKLNLDFKKMAINISPLQLTSTNFIGDIEDRRKHFLLDKRKITLEITESERISSFGLECISELNDMGYSISLDDFGTGYASFQCLLNMPKGLNNLKLDRSFVTNIHKNINQQTIVTAIIKMCTSFNIPVIAEGVESIDEINFLTANGCDHFQGFYFSKPLNEENMIKIAA